MTAVVLCGIFILFGAVWVVACGIHLRNVPSAQRRLAWVTFGVACYELVVVSAFFMVVRNVTSLGVNAMLSGWQLVCFLPLLILTFCIMLWFLRSELRTAFGRRTAHRQQPPPA